MKTAYLADQRRRGDFNDPFLEADRRETAKQEAAAKRVHPTLHLPTNLQPSTQVVGLLTSTTPGASIAPQTSPAASSGGGFSHFVTPASTSASSMSSSLFETPQISTSLFAASPFSKPPAPPTTAAGGSLSSTPFAPDIFLSYSLILKSLTFKSAFFFCVKK